MPNLGFFVKLIQSYIYLRLYQFDYRHVHGPSSIMNHSILHKMYGIIVPCNFNLSEVCGLWFILNDNLTAIKNKKSTTIDIKHIFIQYIIYIQYFLLITKRCNCVNFTTLITIII